VFLCWRPLFYGGGLVGGDTYPYFLPQKQFIGEEFSAGRLPLWHDRTSLGYPLLAESQGGVFYPASVLLLFLDAHTAYHVSFLLHYWLAVIIAWRFARAQGMQNTAAVFTAIVFVYSWFPARASLEWSIIGAVWLPMCLWQTQRLLESPSWSRFFGCAVAFATHLLAGHYSLAFITQLSCFMLVARTMWLQCRHGRGLMLVRSLIPPIAITSAFLLAAVQVLPTLELKQISQRDGSGESSVFQPGYGHLPPLYLTQIVGSWWYWHSPEILASEAVQKLPAFVESATNPVEAHFYPGIIPLLLTLMLLSSRVRYRLQRRAWKFWLLLTVLGLTYATGALIPLTHRLPGFSFFMGPGRYTMISTLGVATAAGFVLDQICARRSTFQKLLLLVLLGTVAFVDVRWSTQTVSDAVVVQNPPWNGLQESWIAETLRSEGGNSRVRLLAPGPNIGNLFGVSSLPQYLGIGPAAYFSEELELVGPEANPEETYPSVEVLAKLQYLSVTHILATEEIRNPDDQLVLVRSGPDTFLNRVWGRGDSPCWLYRIEDSEDRIRIVPRDAAGKFIVRRTPQRFEAEVEMLEAGTLVWSELAYPGWESEVIAIDESGKATSLQATDSAQAETLLRTLALPEGTLRVIWEYRPGSFVRGAVVSFASFSLLMGFVIAAAIRKKKCSQESVEPVGVAMAGRIPGE